MTPIRFVTAAALVASFALPLAAAAQQAPPAPPAQPAGAPAPMHHRGHYLRALRNLNLTDAQRQKIRGAIAQMRQTNQNADPQTRRANAHQLRSQIEGMLTPDQRTQLHTQLRNERRNGTAPQGGSEAPPHA